MSASAVSLGASSSPMTRNALAPRAARPSARTPARGASVVRAALPGARQGHFRAPKFTRDLGEWSEGADVKALQQSLGTMRQDGVFGAETVAAVRLWQRANDIPATGYFGPQSRAKWAKTNGGVRPSWASTAVVVQPVTPASRVAGVADFTGPALLGGFVLAAILKAQDDPLGFEGIFAHAAAKCASIGVKVHAILFGEREAPPSTASGSAAEDDALDSAAAPMHPSWAEYEKEAETREWGWGTPGFTEAREKRRAALSHAVAASMRGPSMSQDMRDFATFEFSDFVRAQETVDPEERQARREELDKKFRERRGLGVTAGSAAMQSLQKMNVNENLVVASSNNVVAEARKEAPLDVSAPVVAEAAAATKTKPRSLPKGFVPASSPSAMAAYEKMMRELEAAEEQSAEKSGPR
jgi:hypothetical protein